MIPKSLIARYFGKSPSWALIIPSVTLVIYLGTYLFLFGYNLLYDIPVTLISIDFAKMSLSWIPILLASVINLTLIFLISEGLGYNSGKPTDKGRLLLTLIFANFALFFAIAVSTSLNRRATLWFAIGGCFIVAALLIKLIPEKILCHFDFEENFSDYKPLQGLVIFLMKRVTLPCTLIVFMGALYASMQTNYLVSAKDPSRIVLNTYGDKFIVGKIEPHSINHLTNEFTIVDPSDYGEFEVKYVPGVVSSRLVARVQK